MARTDKPARPAPELMRMLATARNDITVPNYGTILRPQDETLLAKGGGAGIRLYDEVRRDGWALSLLDKRKRKVLARPWEVTPASDSAIDTRAADVVREVLDKLAFDRTSGDLLEAALYGYAVAEIEWMRDGGLIRPARIVAHSQARFVFDYDWRPRLLTREAYGDGIELPERKFIVHRHDAAGSDPYGRGLGRVLYWHVLFKREGVGFWLHFLEKYASPTPVAKYPYGTPPAEQDRLLNHLLDLVQRGALAVPIGTDIEFLEAARSGSVSYEDWCRYWDVQTSVAILGETLSTAQGESGARAATEAHMEVSDGIADADADMLSGTLNATLVRWITEFNVPGATPPGVWRPRPKNEAAEEESRKRRADRIKAELDNLFRLAGQGYRPAEGIEASLSEITGVDVVADESLRERFGVPAVRQAALGSTALTPPAAFADHDHGVGHLLDHLEAAAQPAIDRWLATIRREIAATLDAGGDLEALRDRLLAVYPELTLDALGNVLAPAVELAELTGRADVADENAGRP